MECGKGVATRQVIWRRTPLLQLSVAEEFSKTNIILTLHLYQGDRGKFQEGHWVRKLKWQLLFLVLSAKKFYRNYWFLLSSAELSHAICQEIKRWEFCFIGIFRQYSMWFKRAFVPIWTQFNIQVIWENLLLMEWENGCIRKQRERKLNSRRKCWFRYSEVTWIICGEKFLISWRELNNLSHFYFLMSVNSDYTPNCKKTIHNGDFCCKL